MHVMHETSPETPGVSFDIKGTSCPHRVSQNDVIDASGGGSTPKSTIVMVCEVRPLRTSSCATPASSHTRPVACADMRLVPVKSICCTNKAPTLPTSSKAAAFLQRCRARHRLRPLRRMFVCDVYHAYFVSSSSLIENWIFERARGFTTPMPGSSKHLKSSLSPTARQSKHVTTRVGCWRSPASM